MPNKKIEYPYCRRCNKTRDNPDEWAKFTTKGEPRKAACCGKCGQMLAWGPRAGDHKPGTSNYPNNIATNIGTKKDITDHIDDWKKFVQVRGAKGGRGSPIYERILKERKKWEQLK